MSHVVSTAVLQYTFLLAPVQDIIDSVAWSLPQAAVLRQQHQKVVIVGDSISMETSPKEQRGRHGQSASSALPNLADRPTVRLPFRPVGALMRCPAPSWPLQAAPLAASLGRRLQHLARAVFINPNFALLWWGQAISSVGDYAWDTALVLWVATYLVAGQSWAPLAVSGLVLAATLPQIVVGPLAAPARPRAAPPLLAARGRLHRRGLALHLRPVLHSGPVRPHQGHCPRET